MKTLALRELVRHPKDVKKLTARGESVRITDNGKPLWLLTPDQTDEDTSEAKEKARQEWLDKYFEDLLAEEPRTGVSTAEFVNQSRGNY